VCTLVTKGVCQLFDFLYENLINKSHQNVLNFFT
jgi:hypothetical protein